MAQNGVAAAAIKAAWHQQSVSMKMTAGLACIENNRGKHREIMAAKKEENIRKKKKIRKGREGEIM